MSVRVYLMEAEQAEQAGLGELSDEMERMCRM